MAEGEAIDQGAKVEGVKHDDESMRHAAIDAPPHLDVVMNGGSEEIAMNLIDGYVMRRKGVKHRCLSVPRDWGTLNTKLSHQPQTCLGRD
jgi:hypothetical protein